MERLSIFIHSGNAFGVFSEKASQRSPWVSEAPQTASLLCRHLWLFMVINAGIYGYFSPAHSQWSETVLSLKAGLLPPVHGKAWAWARMQNLAQGSKAAHLCSHAWHTHDPMYTCFQGKAACPQISNTLFIPEFRRIA